jgi:hypothetical protein
VIDDFLADHGDFDARQVVVTSASSKTASAAAFLFRGRGVRTVGLTSAANVEFTRALGVYDEVLAYEEVDRLAPAPSVSVDVAGNRDVLAAVHGRLGEALAHSMLVGGTHWNAPVTATGPLSPKPQFFFAPTQIAKRTGEWGSAGLRDRVAEAWDRYCPWVAGWLRVEERGGADAVVATWRTLVAGAVDPRLGFVCTLAEDGE